MIRFTQATPEAIAARSRCRDRLVDRMADDMLELGFSGEGATPETLSQRGWTPGTIASLQRDATAVARRRAIRQVGA